MHGIHLEIPEMEEVTMLAVLHADVQVNVPGHQLSTHQLQGSCRRADATSVKSVLSCAIVYGPLHHGVCYKAC